MICAIYFTSLLYNKDKSYMGNNRLRKDVCWGVCERPKDKQNELIASIYDA